MLTRIGMIVAGFAFVAVPAQDAGACTSCMNDEDLEIHTCIEDLTSGWDACWVLGGEECFDIGDPDCEEWLLMADGTAQTTDWMLRAADVNMARMTTARGEYLLTCGNRIAGRELNEAGKAEIRRETSRIAI